MAIARRILDGLARNSKEFQALKKEKDLLEAKLRDIKVFLQTANEATTLTILARLGELTPEQVKYFDPNPELKGQYEELRKAHAAQAEAEKLQKDQHKLEITHLKDEHKSELDSLREELHLDSTGRMNALQRDFANRLVALADYLNVEGEKSPLTTYANGMLQENKSFQAYAKSKKLPELEAIVRDNLEQNLTSRDPKPIIHNLGKYDLHIVPMYQPPYQPLAAVYLTPSNKPGSSLKERLGKAFGLKGKTKPSLI